MTQYRFTDDLIQRAHDVYKKHYNVELTKDECDEILNDLANLYILLSDSDKPCDHMECDEYKR